VATCLIVASIGHECSLHFHTRRVQVCIYPVASHLEGSISNASSDLIHPIMSYFLSRDISMLFQSRGFFDRGSMSFFLKGGDCFPKWGELSLRGRNIFRGQVFYCFLYALICLLFWSLIPKGEKFMDQTKPKLSNTKNHQFIILWPFNQFITFQVVAYNRFRT
jgi:hypothetical protein